MGCNLGKALPSRTGCRKNVQTQSVHTILTVACSYRQHCAGSGMPLPYKGMCDWRLCHQTCSLHGVSCPQRARRVRFSQKSSKNHDFHLADFAFVWYIFILWTKNLLDRIQKGLSSMTDQKNIRNIAIIAHVDHGKTTLVDEMLKQGGIYRENAGAGSQGHCRCQQSRPPGRPGARGHGRGAGAFAGSGRYRRAVRLAHHFLLRAAGHSLPTARIETGTDLTPLFETIVNYIPAPTGDAEAPMQMLVSSIDYNEYVGRIGIGRVERGTVR